MGRWMPLLLLPVLSGCDGLWTWVSQEDVDNQLLEIDLDGDGVSSAAGDCDDNDGDISPDVDEIWYDGVDQDCDGVELCLLDGDADGYRDTSEATVAGGLACDAAGGCPAH